MYVCIYVCINGARVAEIMCVCVCWPDDQAAHSLAFSYLVCHLMEPKETLYQRPSESQTPPTIAESPVEKWGKDK